MRTRRFALGTFFCGYPRFFECAGSVKFFSIERVVCSEVFRNLHAGVLHIMLLTPFHNLTCMYVCMYVCMHVSMYVCMYVCINVWTFYASMYICMYVCIDVWTFSQSWLQTAGSATEIPAFAIAPSTPPNPPQLPPVSARPSVSPTFALSSGLSPPTRPVRAVTAATSPHLPSASPNTIALSPVFVSTQPPNRVNPSLSPSMPSIGVSPPAAITRSPINGPPHGGQSFGALSMSSFAPPAAAASRGFAPVFVAQGF